MIGFVAACGGDGPGAHSSHTVTDSAGVAAFEPEVGMENYRYRHLLHHLSASAGVLLLLSGCGSGDATPDASIAFDQDPLPTDFVDHVPQVALAEDLRIDGYEADLVPVTWLGAGQDGTIVVFQQQDFQIRLFDEDGSAIATFGRQGQGPGEFMRIVRGGWKGDSIWVSDTALRRTTVIAPNGSEFRAIPPLAGVRPAPADSARFPPYSRAYPYGMYDDGEMLMSVLTPSREEEGELATGTPFFRVSSDGVIQRLVFLRVREDGGSLRIDLAGGGLASLAVPFFPQTLFGNSPRGDRIGSVRTAPDGGQIMTVSVRVVDDTGQEVVNRSYPFEGEVIPGSQIDSVLEVRRESTDRTEIRAAWGPRMRALIPEVYPPVRDAVLDDDGRIWLGLKRSDADDPWLVLDSDGVPTAMVRLPPRSRPWAARGDLLWTTVSDELDVQSIVRYRIEGL